MSCKCGCGQDTFDIELSEALEDVRSHFRERLFVVSGNRCEDHNNNVLGYRHSQHLLSKAADIQVENITAKEVYKYISNRYPDKYGIGSYVSFTHIDVRTTKARW